MTNRFYCFTLNNPDGLLDVTFEEWIGNGLRYAVYQHEVGESGTEHFQGYLELDRGQRFSYVLGRIPGAHLEPRRGTQQQAIDYCKKTEGRLDGPWEYGTPSAGAGSRNDIAAFKKAIDDGANDERLWDDHPREYLRYSRVIPQVRAFKAPKRSWKTEVFYIYGPPGTGKSYWAEHHAGEAPYWKSPNETWWTEYSGEESVILDDFSAGWMPWSTLLQVMDAYPLRVPTKGGHANFLAKRLYITSNWKPKELYGKTDEDGTRKFPLDALIRRVTTWVLLFPGSNFEEMGPASIVPIVIQQQGTTLTGVAYDFLG